MSTGESAVERRQVVSTEWGNAPQVSDHADLRWLQRAGVVNFSPREAWVEGYPVGGVTKGGHARLHPPTRTILTSLNGVITTVLDAELWEYTADHLLECRGCGLEFQPQRGERVCPWCGTDNPRVVR